MVDILFLKMVYDAGDFLGKSPENIFGQKLRCKIAGKLRQKKFGNIFGKHLGNKIPSNNFGNVFEGESCQ